MAELVLAVRALQGGVRAVIEAFGMPHEGEFPSCEYCEGEGDEDAGEPADERYQGRRGHDAVPVEDLAGCAATVSHQHELQRTPQDNANHIKEEIEECPDKGGALVEDVKPVKEKPD